MAVLPAFLFIPISAGGTMVVPPTIDFFASPDARPKVAGPDPGHQRLQGRVVFRRADPDREPPYEHAPPANPTTPSPETRRRIWGADHRTGRNE